MLLTITVFYILLQAAYPVVGKTACCSAHRVQILQAIVHVL